jgi:pimeloyl-ACP methyl ester carboxylesterase
MAAVVRTAASERVHVVAGSNGCSTAVRLALEYPDQLRSLTLCWPATPDNNGFRAEFEAAAAAIEAIGPRAYLDRVRGAGVVSPRKEESRFPWSHALLEDERLDRSFRDLTGDMAADVVRTTAAALLADGLIRGVSSDDATRLGLIGIPVAVMPPDPEDLFHASETAQALLEAVPNAHACPEMPIPLSNEFRPARIAYVEALRAVFSSARQPHPASP